MLSKSITAANKPVSPVVDYVPITWQMGFLKKITAIFTISSVLYILLVLLLSIVFHTCKRIWLTKDKARELAFPVLLGKQESSSEHLWLVFMKLYFLKSMPV